MKGIHTYEGYEIKVHNLLIVCVNQNILKKDGKIGNWFTATG